MPHTDPALRAMRRDLLVARATLQRETLMQHWDTLHGRARPALIVADVAAAGVQRLRTARYAGAGSAALRVLARNPWLVASLFAGFRRGRVLKLGLLGVAVAGAAWWWGRHRPSPAQSELPFDALDTPNDEPENLGV